MMAAANSIASTGIVLEPLRKGNYENWSTLVRNYLVGQGLWHGIIGIGPHKPDSGKEDDWVSRNAKALHAIQLACGSENLSNIRTFENARDAWNHLNISFSEDVSAFPDTEDEEQAPESEADTAPEAETEHVDISTHNINKLHSDVSKGDWNSAKSCITRDLAIIFRTTPSMGRTVLHVAVASRRDRIVKELVDKGKQRLVETPDRRGYTALALAAELTDNKDVAEWMINKGGNALLSIRTNDEGYRRGETPVLLASAKGHKQMTRYLFSRIQTDDQLISIYDRRVLFTRCLSAEIFDVAASLLRETWGNHLRYKYINEQHPIMALAHMPSAFPSGAQLGWWDRFIYNSLRLQTRRSIHKGIEIVIHNEPVDEEEDAGTLSNLCTNHCLGRIFRSKVLVPVKRLCRLFGQFLTSVLGILPGSEKIYEMKLNHYLVLRILERLSKVLSKCDETDPRMRSACDAMLLAAKYGNVELINSLMRANPNLLWAMNDNKNGILAHAICHRQEKVFQIIIGIQGWQKENLISHIDLYGNNMLHHAAELGPSSYLNRMSNPALQMQRELQWFKTVERIVPPKYKQAKNTDGMTPHELFTKKHEDLMKAGEQWARDTASSFTVVGTLIITIVFAAAFTVPGGNDQTTGMPIFLYSTGNNQNTGKPILKRPGFLVFIIADTISLIMSSSSVLFFIEILTLRYAMKDFMKSLHKILWGLFTLFFSVTSMMLTFVAALSLMLKDEYPRAIVAASTLAIIPVLVLVHTLLSLTYEILKSARWTPESR